MILSSISNNKKIIIILQLVKYFENLLSIYSFIADHLLSFFRNLFKLARDLK